MSTGKEECHKLRHHCPSHTIFPGRGKYAWTRCFSIFLVIFSQRQSFSFQANRRLKKKKKKVLFKTPQVTFKSNQNPSTADFPTFLLTTSNLVDLDEGFLDMFSFIPDIKAFFFGIFRHKLLGMSYDLPLTSYL